MATTPTTPTTGVNTLEQFEAELGKLRSKVNAGFAALEPPPRGDYSDPGLPKLPEYARTPGLPKFKYDTYKRLAKQTRFLNDEEKAYLRQKFGNSINPDNFRIGYDLGISATNVEGWTSENLPTSIFLSTDKDDKVSDVMAHEATHGWQYLRGKRDYEDRTPMYDIQGVIPKSDEEFRNLTVEQQAELVRFGDPTALKYVREHPASTLPRGDQAFIDSLRQRYDKPSGLGADIDARLGALGGVTEITIRDGQLARQDPLPLQEMRLPLNLEAPPGEQRDQFMAVPDPPGLEVRGNLSIWNRPAIRNDDGTPSTEYSISNIDERDGLEVLVPTVVNGKFLTPDGKKPPEGSDAEKAMFKLAWQHYKDTGEHLGKFRTPEDATAYAHQLHEAQDARVHGAAAQDTGISEQLVQNIKSLEGFRDTAYHNPEDPEGIWTIGYGRTTDVGEGDTTDREFEDSALRATAHDLRSQIKNLVTVPLSPRQLDALTSLSYNIGIEAFKGSTLLSKINASDPTAPDEFNRWIHSAGKAREDLIKRRELEKSWFTGDQAPGAASSGAPATGQVKTIDEFEQRLGQLRQAAAGGKKPTGSPQLPGQIYTYTAESARPALPIEEQKKRFEEARRKNWIPEWMGGFEEPPKPVPSGAGAPSRGQFLTPPPPGAQPPVTNIDEFKNRLAEVKRAQGDQTPVISRDPTWRDTMGSRLTTSGWDTMPFGSKMSEWSGQKFRDFAEAINPSDQTIQRWVQNANPFVLGFLFHTFEGHPLLVDTPDARNRVTNYLQLGRALEIGAFGKVGEFIGDPVNDAFLAMQIPAVAAVAAGVVPLEAMAALDIYFAGSMAIGAGSDIYNAAKIGRELHWNVFPKTGADGKLEWLPGQGEFWHYAGGIPVDAYFARMGIKSIPQRIAHMRVYDEFNQAAQHKYGKDWNALSPEEKTKAYFDVQKKNAGKTQFYPGTYHEWADHLNAMPEWYRNWATKKGYLNPDRDPAWYYLEWAKAFGLRKEPRNYEEAEQQYAEAREAVRKAAQKRAELNKDLHAIDQRMRTPKEHPPNELEPPPIIGGAGYIPRIESIWTPGRERLVTVYEPDVSHGIGDIARMSPDEREWVRQKWREQQAMRVLEDERLRDVVEQHEREQREADERNRAADEAVVRREKMQEQALKIADRRNIRLHIGEAEQFSEIVEQLTQQLNEVAERNHHVSPEEYEKHLEETRGRGWKQTPEEEDFLRMMGEKRMLEPYTDLRNLPIEFVGETRPETPVGPPRTDVMRERLKSVQNEDQARRVLDGADEEQLFDLMHPANRTVDLAGGRSIYANAGERPLFTDRRGGRREGSPWEPLEGVVVAMEQPVHPDDVPPWASPGPLPVPEPQVIPADQPIPDDLYRAGVTEAALVGGKIDAATLQKELGLSEGDAARLLARLRAEGHVEVTRAGLEEPPTAQQEQMYREAVRLAVEFGKASTSLLQRRLHIGYGVASNLIERMEREGIVQPAEGPKPREVIKAPEWAMTGAPTLEAPPVAPPPPTPHRKLGSFILQVVQEGSGDYGSDKYVEPVIVVGRVDETAPRENWHWTDWAAGEYNRRIYAALEDIDLAHRKHQLVDAADDLNRQAGEARGKEAEDLIKAGEEAQRRIEEIERKQQEKRKQDLEATKTTRENWPVEAWIDEVGRGNDTFILLPSGRKIKAHYALVLGKNLVASHFPLNNFTPNPDYIWFDEDMTVSPVQPWDYFHNEDRQNLTKFRAANPELAAIYNTTPTGTDGPAVVRADGKKLGGNNRDFIHDLMYQAGRGQEIVDMINATKGQFGIIEDTPDASHRPEIVRVADDPIESRQDLIDVGDELNRPSGTQASVSEESAALARRFTQDFKDWIVAAFDAMDDDATLRSFMTMYTEDLAKRMAAENWFSPNQRGEWVRKGADGKDELTETAKKHFENAARGLVIKDSRALQLLQSDGMRSMGQTIDRALPGLVRMVAKNGIWDVSDYLSAAIRTYGEIIEAQKSIDNTVALAHDEMKRAKMSQRDIDRITRVDGLLYPDKLLGYTPPLTGEVGEGVRKPPKVDLITESLMRLIELKSGEIKKAIQGYSLDAEGKQRGMFAPTAPWESFTVNISNQFGITLEEKDWGRLEKEAEDKPLQGDLPPRTADVQPPAGPGPNETAMREALAQHGGIQPAMREAAISIWRRWAEKYLREPFEQFLGRVLKRIEVGGEYKPTGEPTLKQEEPASRLDRIRERMRERRKLINKKYRDHLTSEQLDDLTKSKKTARQLADVIKDLPAIKEWEETAKAGAVARKWYEKAALAFDSLSEVAPQTFPPEDRQRWVDFLAAISPRQDVKLNLIMALEHWGKWIDAGRPLNKSALRRLFRTLDVPARIPNAVRAILGENLSGYKVSAFGKSLYGIHGWIPNDTWMRLFSGLSRVDRAKFNHAINVRVRQVAERLGWHDEEVQAAIWAFTKALGETTGKATNYDPVEALGKLTNEEIAERMADMSVLLRDDDIQDTLQALGVDTDALNQKLGRTEERYAQVPTPKPFGIEAADPDVLRRVARRLRAGLDEKRAAEAEELEPPPTELLQAEKRGGETIYRGETAFLEDGMAIIRLFNSATFSTLMEESMHVMRRQLKPEDIAILERNLNQVEGLSKIQNGVWLVEHEEKLTDWWKRYLRDGKEPSNDPELIKLFRKLKAWMVAIYRDLKKHPELGAVPKEVAAVFDRLLEGEEEETAAPPEAPPETPVEPTLEPPPGEAVPLVPRDSQVVYRGTGPDPTTLGKPLQVQQFDSPEKAMDWVLENADKLEGVLVHKTADGKAYVQYVETPPPPPPMEAPPEAAYEDAANEVGYFVRDNIPANVVNAEEVMRRLVAGDSAESIFNTVNDRMKEIQGSGLRGDLADEFSQLLYEAARAGKTEVPPAEPSLFGPPPEEEEPQPPEQARLIEKQDLRELLPEGVRVYASGAERVADLNGFIQAGVPVGLSMQRVGKTQLRVLGNLAGTGIPVFLDSGAYSEGREPEMISGAIDWDRVLDGYEELSKKLGAQLTVVAPDRVGDQNETLARLANNSDRLRQIAGNGARIVMPIQVGELSLTDFYQAARALAGTRIVPGFPMAKAVADPQAIVDFVRQIGPDEIHLLGLGGSNAKTDLLVRALRDAKPDLQISMDAVATRAKVGEGRPVTEKQRAYRMSMLEGVMGEVDLRRWGGPALDFTELIGTPSEWASKKQLQEIAEAAGMPEPTQREFVKDPEGWIGSHDVDDWLYQTLIDAYHKFVGKEVAGPARTAAITETFEEGKIGRQIEPPPPEESREMAPPPERSPAEMTFNEFKTQPNVLAVPKSSILAFDPEKLTHEKLSQYPLTQVQMLANLLGVNKSGSKKAISERIVKRVQLRQRLKKETVESLKQNYKSTELYQMVKEAGTFGGGTKDSMARVLMKWLDDGTQKIRHSIVDAKLRNHVVKAAKNGLPVNPENLRRYKLNSDGTPAPTMEGEAALRERLVNQTILGHEVEEPPKLEAPPPASPVEDVTAQIKKSVARYAKGKTAVGHHVVNEHGFFVSPPDETLTFSVKNADAEIRLYYTGEGWIWSRSFQYRTGNMSGSSGPAGPGDTLYRSWEEAVAGAIKEAKRWFSSASHQETKQQAEATSKMLEKLDKGPTAAKSEKRVQPVEPPPGEEGLQQTLDLIAGAVPPEAAGPEFTKRGTRMVEVDLARIETGDIDKSYSGDTIGDKGKIRGVVMIEGKPYVNTGGGGGGGMPQTADLVRLYTPEEWGNKPIYDRTHINPETGYEGIKVTHRKNTYIIGGRKDTIRAIPKGTPPEVKQRLFQADRPGARDLKISVLRGMLNMNPDPEKRAKLEYMLAELTGEPASLAAPPAPKVEVPAEKKPVEKPKEVKSAGEPPVEKKAALPKTVRIWTPRGEVEVELPPKGVGRGEEGRRTDKGGKPPDGVDRGKDTPRAPGVPVETRQQPGGGEDRPTGRRVPTSGGERPERGGRGAPRKTLQDVPPTRIEAPKRGRGTPLYDEAEWRERAKLYGLPDGMPVPFVRLDDDLRLLFPYPGQQELLEGILSGLAQHDSFVLASTTGTGKTFMANGVLQQLMRRQKMDRVLFLTASQNLVKDFKKVAVNYDNEVKALPEGVSVPDEPGIYATTYATALNRDGIEDYPWDLIIADEIAQARRALMGSKQGSMMKVMSGNAKQILYMSATPFHTALEIGHMEKLGLWDNQGGYDAWSKQFGVYKDKNGKYGGGNAPRLLTRLREQLIERGQYANIDRNMDGYHPNFLLAPLNEEDKAGLKAIREGFELAKHYYATHGKRNKVRALQGIMVVYMKSYLERRRLPAAIELAKKGEKLGYKAIFFSEHRAGRDEIFDILEEPDEYYRGEISSTMPKLPDVVETLQAAFPNDLANFSGAASEIREEEKKSFLENLKKHIFATYGAGGVGVNLHDEIGNRPRMAIYLGLPYSGVMLDQAIGRPWRYGTKSDVLAYFLLSDSRAEVDLVLKKVMPRMESLRAVVSGVDMTDPLTVSMRELESSKEAALGYDLGEQHKVDANDLETVVTRVPIMNYKNAPMPPAEELMNKGMKYPGTVAKHPGISRLMQREEYEPSKEELGMEELPLPEDSEARLLNEEIGDDLATGRGAPGVTPEELSQIPTPRRIQLAKIGEGVAESEMPRFEDDEDGGNPSATIRRIHENNMKWAKAVMGVAPGAPPPPGGGPPEPPDEPPDEGPDPNRWIKNLIADAKNSKTAETFRESTVAGAGRAVDMAFFTSGQTLIKQIAKKYGVEELGEDLVRDIGRYHRDAGNVSGPLIQRYLDIVKKHKLSEDEHHNMWLVKEEATRRVDEDDPNSPKVRVQPLNDRVSAAVEDVRKFTQDLKDILAKEGIATKWRDPVTGEKRWRYFADQLDDPKYMPHRYDYDQKIVVLNKETGKKETITLRQLLKGKKLGDARYKRMVEQLSKKTGRTVEEVEDWLNDRPDRDVPLVGNIERPRDVDMPYYRTDKLAMVEYLFGLGEIVARERIFGQDRQKLDLKIRKVPNADAREDINDIFDSLLKRRHWDEDNHKFVQLAANWAVLAHMTLSAVKVPFHAFHASLYTDARTLGSAILQFSLHPSETKRWAQYIGATIEQMRANLRAELGIKRGAASWMLDHNAFHSAYTMDRALTAAAARIYLDNRALPKLLRGKNVDYMRRQLRNVFLLDDGAINRAIENKRWTDADYAGAGKRFSDLVMGTADPTELPPAWRARSGKRFTDTALAAVRITTLLRSFMFKTSRILKDRLINEVLQHNNWRAWIPFLVLYPAAGAVMRQISQITSARQEDEPEYKWWLDPKHHTVMQMLGHAAEDIAWPIAYTELMMFNTAFSGDSVMLRALEMIVGPDISDLVRPFKFGFDITKAKTDYGVRQAWKHWATGQFSIAGPIYRLEEWLTGYDPKKEKKKAEAKRRQEEKFKPHPPRSRSAVPGLEAPPLR